MEKLPKSIDLKWHRGYDKELPKTCETYAVILHSENGEFESCLDFAIFITETINGHNFDRWRLLFGDVYLHGGTCEKIHINDWASLEVVKPCEIVFGLLI